MAQSFSLLMVLFVLVAWGGIKSMMLNSAAPNAVSFPTLDTPNISFHPVPDDCSGFGGALDCIADGVINFVLGIVYIVVLIFDLAKYVVQLFALIVQVAFQPIPGAPALVNVLIALPFAAAVGIIIYAAFRKGDTAA